MTSGWAAFPGRIVYSRNRFGRDEDGAPVSLVLRRSSDKPNNTQFWAPILVSPSEGMEVSTNVCISCPPYSVCHKVHMKGALEKETFTYM